MIGPALNWGEYIGNKSLESSSSDTTNLSIQLFDEGIFGASIDTLLHCMIQLLIYQVW